jgi:hypothetical protein
VLLGWGTLTVLYQWSRLLGPSHGGLDAMDPASLAIAVVSLLAPYLKRLGGHMADKVADDLTDAVQGKLELLYQTLKARLRSGSYEVRQLEGVEAKPDSPRRLQALESALAEYLPSDPALTAELERLVTEVTAVGGVRVQAADAGIVAGGNVTQWAGGDIVGRDKIGGDRVGKDKLTYAPPRGPSHSG